MATKDRVRDGDQSWAGPFLPRGEVVSSSIFCLERQVSCETLAALLAQIPHLPQPPAQLPGRQRSQSPWTGFGHESRGLRPPGQGRLQQPPQPPRPLPQAGPLGPPLPAANKENVRDLAAAAPSPLLAFTRSTHGLRGRQQGAGQSVDDAIEGQDVPHDDAADHNCPWDL